MNAAPMKKPTGPLKIVLACVLAATAVGGYRLIHRAAGDGHGPVPAVAPDTANAVPAETSRIRTVETDTHQTLPSTAPDGTPRVAPALPTLEQAIGLASGLSFARRLQVVHALDAAKLTPAQADTLLAFVAEKRLPAGLSTAQLRALKNDILNVLVARPASAPALAATLRAIHEDLAQEPGMRDYALQFLAALHSRDSADAAPQWAAIQGDDPALAATALLQLLSFSREGKLPAADQTRLAAAASQLAADTTAPEPSRATALQVCGQLRLVESRQLAHDLARDARVGFPLRIAAVATLGDLGGDAAIRDYLTALTTGPEKRLRIPAESALKRFTIN